MSGYKNPEVLVSTDWVQQHLNDSGVKLIEVDVNTKAYEAGHIRGAIGFNWQTQLQDQLRRDIVHGTREEVPGQLQAASAFAS